jgi:hypothetical protein
MKPTDLPRQETLWGSFHGSWRPKRAITLSRKDWHSAANRAVLVTVPGARRALGILPRRLHGRGGASLLAVISLWSGSLLCGIRSKPLLIRLSPVIMRPGQLSARSSRTAARGGRGNQPRHQIDSLGYTVPPDSNASDNMLGRGRTRAHRSNRGIRLRRERGSSWRVQAASSRRNARGTSCRVVIWAYVALSRPNM